LYCSRIHIAVIVIDVLGSPGIAAYIAYIDFCQLRAHIILKNKQMHNGIVCSKAIILAVAYLLIIDAVRNLILPKF